MNTANVIELRVNKPKRGRGYDYANLKTFTKSQIGGLTKHLAGLRFGCNGTNQDKWTLIFNRGEELGLEIGYSEAHGERLDFKVPRKITAEQNTFLVGLWISLKAYLVLSL